VVPTSAFGVSVDCSHVRMVLHVDEPDSMIVGRCMKTRGLDPRFIRKRSAFDAVRSSTNTIYSAK
jgi:hypothetical protein